jgi:heptosyltransferase-2
LGLWLVGAPDRAGYAADARRFCLTVAVSGRIKLAGLHTVYYYLGILRAFGEVATFTPPGLYLDSEELLTATQLMAKSDAAGAGPWIGLSPGAAYGPAKRWPPERFAAVAEELREEFGASLVILGGPEDREAADQVMAHLRVPALNLAGKTGLRQALAVLKLLKLLLTNDSGLMHAAAALEVPLLALFGSTDPEATGPFTARATVLRHPLPCSPCLKRTCDQGYTCLTDITVPEVAAAARQWLKESL